MNKKEIRTEIKRLEKELKEARGCDYVRISEDLETLTFLLISKKG